MMQGQAVLVFGLFCILATYSYLTTPHRLVTVWKNKEAAEVASVYGLTPTSVGEPVVLWEVK